MYRETFSITLCFKATASTMKETGYKLEKVTVLLRETWTPEGHKEG